MKYYTDDFVDGCNPSDKGGGYTILDEEKNLIKQEYVEKRNFTNNEGEILGIYNALLFCEKGDTISTDSMCCLTWVGNGKSKARPDLNEILKECKELRNEKKVNLMWEGREFNIAGQFNELEHGFVRAKLSAILKREMEAYDNFHFIE